MAKLNYASTGLRYHEQTAVIRILIIRRHYSREGLSYTVTVKEASTAKIIMVG